MRLVPPTAGKVCDTSAAIDVAMVFVWTDMHFVRFTVPMDHMEGWVIGVPIPSVAGVTDSDAPMHLHRSVFIFGHIGGRLPGVYRQWRGGKSRLQKEKERRYPRSQRVSDNALPAEPFMDALRFSRPILQ
jgi:hypothetical protein